MNIDFFVPGRPVPKQSTRFDGHGHAHTAPHVKAWAEQVRTAAIEAMAGREPATGDVCVSLIFYMPTRHRTDCENLAKNVNDALNGVVYKDDTQVTDLRIQKIIDRERPGVSVEVSA
jgi:Holliday junction resolvase RusA-like endonuclease